ncbi:MAG: hypothetical protein ACRDTM_04715 [Micromonosporaceae bacterium]
MSTDEVRELFCASCAEVVRFELLSDPYAADGAYDEWACTICGAGILTDSYAGTDPAGTDPQGTETAGTETAGTEAARHRAA